MNDKNGSSLPEHVLVNQTHWNEHAHEWVAMGERAWASQEITWGMWAVPESGLQLLPASLEGVDTIELGCGTGYISAWLAQRGANAVGIDISEEQLATAQRLSEEHGVPLTLVHGSAEDVPYPNASFDYAVSEYGAVTWCDPYVWVPEAYRLLRPGGTLISLATTPLAALCSRQDGGLPVTEALQRDYFGMGRFDWRDAVDEPGGIDFVLPTGEAIALFTSTGFVIEAFHELQAHDLDRDYTLFTTDWAYRWPSEQVWKLRKPE